ncbi:MAG: bifunctional folylpolyglutamate synthase/dihydrofolate synthase [Alphaproteobacteria bacterium]
MHQADLKHTDKTLQTKLEEIFQLRRTRSKINWDRDQYFDLLSAFGNPHLDLPPVIHVAGTNGKGSIVAMLRTILSAAGLKVHSYTSPHLIHVNERIHLAGKPIEDTYLETLIDQALSYNQDAPLSFFEITTALAFRAFSDTPADILLLEVGMGGTLDCTNVIEDPLCTIINRISMDHTDFLGNDIETIAAQKSGIMKNNTPCIVGYQGSTAQSEHVIKTIYNAAKNKNAPLYLCNKDWHITPHKTHFDFTYNERTQTFPLPALNGMHQVHNAGVALATLETIKHKFTIPDTAIEYGLQSAQWPGRLQKIEPQHFNLLPSSEIWLDCGHNDSAADALIHQIQKWQNTDKKNTHLIIGMLQTKNPTRFLSPLLPHIKSLNIVPISSDPNSFTKKSILEALHENTKHIPACHEYGTIFNALSDLTEQHPESRIIVAGSVYLAGEILQRVPSA